MGLLRLAALSSLLALTVPLPADAQLVPEAELKAAFIYNFAMFTEWPAEAFDGDGLFHICVAPDSPLRAALKKLSGQALHGRSVQVQDAPPPVWAQAGCQIAVLDGGEPPDGRPGVLTVGDGAPQGAIIGLLLQNQHLRFDIDASAARRAGLEPSSKLLRLARVVR
jgi:hypothetical protein